MKCKICGKEIEEKFQGTILKKYKISYYHCNNCYFLQTEEPYWCDEAYKSPINITDTGILSRNLYLGKMTSILIYFLFDKNAKFLDYAGGYGIFTRLMRDIGFDFSWHDPYTKNIFAKGFTYQEANKIELLTTFESFEHFQNPLKEIEKMLAISENIFFSTDVLSDNIPKPEDWWYYGLNHGQHIGFYSIKTLEFIAKKYGLNLYSNGKNLHLFTKKKINPKKFWFLIKIAPRLKFDWLIKRQIVSKTFSDMEMLKNENII